MTVRTLVRAGAVVLAITGIVDPAWTFNASGPLPVDLRAVGGIVGESQQQDIEDLRRRLEQSLGREVELNSSREPAAIISAGDRIRPEEVPEAVPLFVVSSESVSPAVRIASVSMPASVLPGWSAPVHARIESAGLKGLRSEVVLESRGVELGRAERVWSSDRERWDVAFSFLPPSAGTWPLRLRVAEPSGVAARHVDVVTYATARRLAVLAYDARPSWAAAFVRRALESDPVFNVSALSRASRGIAVRSGTSPGRLTPETLEPYDLVLVGAPEELEKSDVQALETFARRRGGTVVLLPDRRPSGACLTLIPAARFEEVLLENSVEITPDGGPVFRASEIVLPVDPGAGAQPVATVPHGGGRRAVIVRWTVGEGHVVFAGALDAWRHRAGNAAFGMFWRQHVAAAAASAPAKVEVELSTGIAAPGTRVAVRAQVRPTEIVARGDRLEVPDVSARVVGDDGTSRTVRLWPSAETGRFEGNFEASAAGRYDVQVALGSGARTDVPFLVQENAVPPERFDRESVSIAASGTGGLVASMADLSPLVRALKALPRPPDMRTVRPARAWWWTALFVILLGTEWTIRRRKGRR
jgi:hypothetical protein